MVLEGKEVIQDVKCRHGEGDKGIGNNEDKTWLRNTSGRENHERERERERNASVLFIFRRESSESSELPFRCSVA